MSTYCSTTRHDAPFLLASNELDVTERQPASGTGSGNILQGNILYDVVLRAQGLASIESAPLHKFRVYCQSNVHG